MGLYAAGDDVDASGVVSSSAAGGGFVNRLHQTKLYATKVAGPLIDLMNNTATNFCLC